MGNRVIKGYELLERIGEGGFGEVYRAHQPIVDREVAIKFILPELANMPDFIRNFEVEAQLVARLEHPFIVPLYDYWRDSNGAYLVMRFLRGGSLSESLKIDGPWTLLDTARLLDQIAAALTVAHRKGVVHRDLKPANILLDEEMNAYLSDFGIAKNTGNAEEEEAQMGILGSPAFMAPEQIMLEDLTARTDIYALGILIYVMLLGRHPFENDTPRQMIMKQLEYILPALHQARPELPQTMDAVIQKATAKDASDRYPDALAMAAEFRAAIGLTTLQIDEDTSPDSTRAETLILDSKVLTTAMHGIAQVAPANPYKGLRAFEEADAVDFFGRDDLVNDLLGRMGEDGPYARFLAVIGPSGSGKSSAVKAGLIPAIRKGALAGSRKWYIVEMIPGAHPLEELTTALQRVAVNLPEDFTARLLRDDSGFIQITNQILPDDDAEMVLVIDQFEETFTLAEDDLEREAFLAALRAAVTNPDSRLRVIITLRADFTDRPLQHANFGDLMRQRTEFVLPLSREELENAITGPARRAGLKVDADLTAAIVAEIYDEPGALPLLQYALTEVFERRQGDTLTLAAYQESGGALGALARRAQELYEGMDDVHQEAARQLFLRLVALGEGTEDTRRRVLLSELHSLESEGYHIRHVQEIFGKYRLLTFDRDEATRTPTVEVAHEALLREWGQLRRWLDDNRAGLRLQRQLATAASQWKVATHDESFLLTGGRLVQFEEWAQGTGLALADAEKAFLDASIAAREASEEAESQRAEHERRLEQQARTRLQALVVILMVAAGLGVFLAAGLFQQSQRVGQERDAAIEARSTSEYNQGVAERRATEVESLVLIQAAEQALTANDAESALAFALAASAGPDSPQQAEQVLWRAASASKTRRVYTGHSDWVRAVAVSPDGHTILSGSDDSTARLWNLDTGEELFVLPHQNWINSVDFSPDGTLAATGTDEWLARLWDVATGEEVGRFEGHEGWVNSVAFSPDGVLLATASADSTIRVWNIERRAAIDVLRGHDGEVTDIAFSPDGTRLYSVSEDMTLRGWDVETGEQIQQIEGHTGWINTIAVSNSGQFAVTGAEDFSVRQWNLETGEQMHEFDSEGPTVNLDISPDDRSVLTSTGDGIIIEWNLSSAREAQRFRDFRNSFQPGIAYTPDGRHAVTGSADGVLRLWDLRNRLELAQFPHDDAVLSVTPLRSGTHVLTGSGRAAPTLPLGQDNTMRLWEVLNNNLLREYVGHEDAILSIGVNSSETIAASASYDGSIILWDIDSGNMLQRIEVGESVRFVDFGQLPDQLIYVTNGEIMVTWDTQREQATGFIDFSGLGEEFMRLTPDLQRVVSREFVSENVHIRDVVSGQLLMNLSGHSGPIVAVEFPSLTNLIVTASLDSTTKFWDLNTGDLVDSIMLDAPFRTMATAPDGNLVVYGLTDGSLILYDRGRGFEAGRWRGHSDYINSIAFVAGGPPPRVVSVADDNSMRLWEMNPFTNNLTDWITNNRYVRPIACSEAEELSINIDCEDILLNSEEGPNEPGF